MENLPFLALYWNRIMEGSLFWHIGRLPILINSYNTTVTTKQVARKMLFPPCLIEHIPLSQIKTTYTKKTLNKIFQRITNASHRYPGGRDQNKV